MRILHCGPSLRVALFATCLTAVDPIAAHASSTITGISLSYKQDVLGLDVGAPPSTAAPINTLDGLVTLPDEHSTIVSDGGGAYTFYVASRTTANPVSTGLVVLSGGVDSASHLWTIAIDPNNLPSQVFLSPVLHNTVVNNAAFDLNYAAPGSVLQDPTNPGTTLMVYSATNRSIGLASGSSTLANGAYNSVAIATSTDGGTTWPTYASVGLAPPGQSGTAGPTPVNGATGSDVCAGYAGGTCNAAPNSAYGRYPVVQPTPTITSLMGSAGTSGLPYTIGDGSPSGFIDTHSGSSSPYLYAIYGYVSPPPGDPTGPETSQLTISRALLNGGSAPLSFEQWDNGHFLLDGIGAASDPSAIQFLPGPETKFQSCEGPNQIQTAGSISYVPTTDQYLLTFACISRGGDPANGIGDKGAAWFFATNSNLDFENGWSQPQEIGNSWEPFDPNIKNCDSYDGWYPSLMSQNMSSGEIGLDGYAFYLDGCRGDPTIGQGRFFKSAYFTIDTTATPEPLTLSLFGGGLAGVIAIRRRKKTAQR